MDDLTFQVRPCAFVRTQYGVQRDTEERFFSVPVCGASGAEYWKSRVLSPVSAVVSRQQPDLLRSLAGLDPYSEPLCPCQCRR